MRKLGVRRLERRKSRIDQVEHLYQDFLPGRRRDFGATVEGAEDGMLHGHCSVYVGRSIASRLRKTGRVGGHKLGAIHSKRHVG